MTSREREILDIIRKNPFISQKDLAEKLGITRSSAAVHIANLVKKGYIKGKGYILEDKKYVTVIGGANVDIQGFPDDRLKLNDSNPGKIKISLGGVARNISENLVKMDVETKLITAIGDDLYGNKILNECKISGIDMEDSLILKNRQSSIYLSILNENGDMKVAIADMDIIDEINIDYIRSKSHIIKNSEVVVLDTNLKKEVIEYLVSNFKEVDFLIDAVSTAKVKKIKDIIGCFHTIKPNKLEAEILVGFKIDSKENIKKAIRYFIDSGVKRVYISLGEKGVYFGDEEKIEYLPSPKVKVVNTTGAGDAFIAGLTYSYLNNLSLKESALFSMAASLLTISHKNTINPNMSLNKIQEKLKEMTKC
ncbi:carbohydrate kinase [Caminicella sporogenes]|uniref:carbohydrate kinase n=1 Tax=Caminicella sporogenes TaxID=166485 RepID=UPI00253FF3DC|nr:carbohydrate kinase [Caminicella sporogenes]WIF95335.1 winged helix-turn-helix transcriptional regulator [Caminicella sporogenes]